MGPGHRSRYPGRLGGPARAVRTGGPGEGLPGGRRVTRETGFAVSPVVANSWARFLEKVDAPSRTSELGPGARGLEGRIRGRRPHSRDGRPLAPPRSRPPPSRPSRARGRERSTPGSLGAAIIEFAGPHRRLPLAPDDLAAHRADWVEPIGVPYRGCEVWEIPPNGQGIAALMGLAILEGFELARHPHVSAGELASRDGGDEARLRRHPPLRGRPRLLGRCRSRRC